MRATGQVVRTRENDAAFRELIESRAILLYVNDGEWYALHPLVRELALAGGGRVTVSRATHAGLDAQEAELAALRRALSASAGCFSLSVAICNSPRLRDFVVAETRRDHQRVSVVSVPAGTVDVFGAVSATVWLSPAHDAIFVIGLETCMQSCDEQHPTLRSLNASRELWEQAYRCPVVFWLPEYAATLLTRHAPDLWRYRSHQFEFVPERVELRVPFAVALNGASDHASNLPVARKQFRMAELHQRLTDVGQSPPSHLLAHAAEWAYELGYLHLFQDEQEPAAKWYRVAVRNYARAANRIGVSATLHQMGMIAHDDGDHRRADRLYARALAISDSLPDDDASAATLCQLGTLAQDMGEPTRAERLFLESMVSAERAQSAEGSSAPCHNLAALHLRAGRVRQARLYCDWSLRFAQEGEDQHGLSVTLQLLGTIEHESGNVSEAVRNYSRSIRIRRRIGDYRGAERVEALLARLLSPE